MMDIKEQIEMLRASHPRAPNSNGWDDLSDVRFQIAHTMEKLLARNELLEAGSRALGKAKALVDTQADDEGLWFDAETAPEAYVMAALRELHQAVEDAHSA